MSVDAGSVVAWPLALSFKIGSINSGDEVRDREAAVAEAEPAHSKAPLSSWPSQGLRPHPDLSTVAVAVGDPQYSLPTGDEAPSYSTGPLEKHWSLWHSDL